MGNALSSPVAEINTIIDYPLGKVKQTIIKVGEKRAGSGITLVNSDSVFNSLEFSILLIRSGIGPILGKTEINLLPKDDKTNIIIKSYCNTYNLNSDYASISVVRGVQTKIMNSISAILEGKEVNETDLIPHKDNDNNPIIGIIVIILAIILFISFMISAASN